MRDRAQRERRLLSHEIARLLGRYWSSLVCLVAKAQKRPILPQKGLRMGHKNNKYIENYSQEVDVGDSRKVHFFLPHYSAEPVDAEMTPYFVKIWSELSRFSDSWQNFT